MFLVKTATVFCSAALPVAARRVETITATIFRVRMVASDWLEPENLLAVVEIRQQRRRRPIMEHRAALQREDAVGQRQHEVEIVLDDQDRDVLPQPVEHAEQLED